MILMNQNNNIKILNNMIGRRNERAEESFNCVFVEKSFFGLLPING